MIRGEIWTAAAGSGYAGKPRPAVVIQDDRFDATDSVTIIAFTTDPTEAPLFRLPITPSPQNGLHDVSSESDLIGQRLALEVARWYCIVEILDLVEAGRDLGVDDGVDDQTPFVPRTDKRLF